MKIPIRSRNCSKARPERSFREGQNDSWTWPLPTACCELKRQSDDTAISQGSGTDPVKAAWGSSGKKKRLEELRGSGGLFAYRKATPGAESKVAKSNADSSEERERPLKDEELESFSPTKGESTCQYQAILSSIDRAERRLERKWAGAAERGQIRSYEGKGQEAFGTGVRRIRKAEVEVRHPIPSDAARYDDHGKGDCQC